MAGRDVVAELSVNLTMETAAFSRGAGVAEARAKSMEGRLGSLGKRASAAGSALTGMAGGFVAGLGTAAVAGVGALVVSSLQYASSLGEVAQQLGVTTKELQSYRYAATQAGIEQGTMDSSLARLTKNIGLASGGNKAAAKTFADLGISLKNADGSFLSAGQALPLIAEKLKGIANPAEKAAILTSLFGKAGQQLLPLLSDGAKGVNELAGAAEKLGIIISDEQIAKADAAADKWAAYKQIITSKIAIGTVEGLDGLVEIDKAISRVQEATSGWLREMDAELSKIQGITSGALRSVDQTVAGWQQTTSAAFKSVASAVGSVAMAFGSLPGKVSAYLAQMVNSVRDWLGAKLQAAVAPAKNAAQQVGDAFRAMYVRVVGNSDVPDMVNEVGQWFDRLDGAMVSKADAATKKVGDKFQALRDRLKPLMADLFPEVADGAERGAKLDDLIAGESSGLLSGSQAGEARKRLWGMEGLESASPVNDPGDLAEGLGVTIEELTPAMEKLKLGTEGLASKYEDIAQTLVNVISGLFGGSKWGRVAGAVLQAGMGIAKQFGAFGGARAKGGPVVPGKTYLVGEKGPEYATFGRRGYITPNGANDNGGRGSTVRVVPSPYFNVVVDGRAAGVAAPMAGRAAVAGAAGGMAGMQRRAARRIP